MNFTPKQTFSSVISEHLANTKESSVLGVRALSSKTHAFAPGFGTGQKPQAPAPIPCLTGTCRPALLPTSIYWKHRWECAVESADMGSGSTVV